MADAEMDEGDIIVVDGAVEYGNNSKVVCVIDIECLSSEWNCMKAAA